VKRAEGSQKINYIFPGLHSRFKFFPPGRIKVKYGKVFLVQPSANLHLFHEKSLFIGEND